jgi:RNA polymerase sigma-70 factor (ECF subfamily)
MDKEAPASVSDEELLRRYVGGDAGAFAQLVNRFTPELFRFLLRFLGQRAVVEDILQETFIQVHLSAATFDPDRRVKPWLFTIAANKARDQLRSRSRRREISTTAVTGDDEASGGNLTDVLPRDEHAPDEALEHREQALEVRRVVRDMPPHLREVLVLAYFHRFAYRDLAEILGVPIGTVKSRLHAAVSHFGTAYRRAGGEEVPSVVQDAAPKAE